MSSSFDLIHDPWIPVLDRTGALRETGLQDILLNAGNYQSLECENPLETIAIYRFLLAILHRALEGPAKGLQGQAAKRHWMQAGFPAEKINAYLQRYAQRFFLFDPVAPFYQLADLPFEGYTQHWSKLSVAEGSGNTSFTTNAALRKFAPKEKAGWLSPAQAVRKIFEHQTFVLGGLIKKFIVSAPGAPVNTAALTLIQGQNLLETLCLNLVGYTYASDRDQPCWEKPPLQTEEVKQDPKIAAEGIVQTYTWFSRSIRLMPEKFGSELGVQQIAYASGLRFEPVSTDLRDPMVTYVATKESERMLGFEEGRVFWRDYHTLLTGQQHSAPGVFENALQLFSLDYSYTPQVLIFGQGNNQGKVLFWRFEAYPVPPALLKDAEQQQSIQRIIQRAITLSEDALSQLNTSAYYLARLLLSPGERDPDTKDINKLKESFPLQMAYWSQLDQAFSHLLSQLVTGFDAQEIETQWRQAVLKAGKKAWRLTCLEIESDASTIRATTQAAKAWNKYKYMQLMPQAEPIQEEEPACL